MASSPHAAAGRDLASSGFVSHNDSVDDREAEDEIRALFAEWLKASDRKDIDGAMAPVAEDIVSYEHDAPLQYVGVDAVREVCQKGFDYAEGDLNWSIPDLKILVRGDLAVTWGLNRMHTSEGGKTKMELWSRGTRIFIRRDGRWQMVHQHVSFPTDEDGRSVMDAKPE